MKNQISTKEKIILFFSWLKTLIWFYILRKFRRLNSEQVGFLEKSFKPQNKRDEKLTKIILNFNKNRLKINQ